MNAAQPIRYPTQKPRIIANVFDCDDPISPATEELAGRVMAMHEARVHKPREFQKGGGGLTYHPERYTRAQRVEQIIHAVGDGELTAQQIADQIGLNADATRNILTHMKRTGIADFRRQGNATNKPVLWSRGENNDI
jgi:predicted Rossmann fold nucleotide-binding protein DprA/Smf involved in DNA uptake